MVKIIPLRVENSLCLCGICMIINWLRGSDPTPAVYAVAVVHKMHPTGTEW